MSEWIELAREDRDTPLSLPICYIVRDDGIGDGEPTIEGVRISQIYAMASCGVALDKIREHFPELTKQNICTAINYSLQNEPEMKKLLIKQKAGQRRQKVFHADS